MVKTSDAIAAATTTRWSSRSRGLRSDRTRSLSLAYRIMYGIGFTPWDNRRVPEELKQLVDGPGALVPARALDMGCRSGTQSVYLAGRGWQGTGIAAVHDPLGRCRSRCA